MKLARIFLLASLLPCLAVLTTGSGCSSPSAQVAAVETLKSIGQSAESAVALAADLYGAKQITADQARAVILFYNQTFQPAFRIAKDAVKGDLSSVAPADLVALGAQLTELVRKTHSP